MMVKTIFVALGAVAALGVATPAVAGLAGNTALSKHIGVQVAPSPSASDDSRSTRVPEPRDDHGRHVEPGDDKGGLRGSRAPEPGDDKGGLRTTRAVEPGDDRGRHVEPGDDHGGARASRTAEPGDDHGGSRSGRGGGHGSDD